MQVGDKFYAPGHPLRRTVQSITTNADTSKTFNLGIDPDDNPADPAYDLNTQITRLGDAHQQSIRTGAKYTSTAYGLYGEAAKFLAMGPLSELGSAALGTIAEEAGGLLNAAREAEKVAQADATLAAEARTIAAEARQAEQGLTDVQQVAALEQKAVDAGQKATQLEAGAAEAQSMATEAENLGNFAQEGVTAQTENVAAHAEPQILTLPQNGTPNFAQNALGTLPGTEYEVALAQKASILRGAHYEGPPTGNFKGIDGWLDGIPTCLQKADTGTPSNIRNALGKARGDAWKAGYKGVEVFIEAPGAVVQDVIDYSGTNAGKSLRTLPGKMTIRRVTIFCGNGIVQF